MEDEVLVGQVRKHLVLGRCVVRCIVGRLVLVEFENGYGHTYFEDIVKGFKLIK